MKLKNIVLIGLLLLFIMIPMSVASDDSQSSLDFTYSGDSNLNVCNYDENLNMGDSNLNEGSDKSNSLNYDDLLDSNNLEDDDYNVVAADNGNEDNLEIVIGGDESQSDVPSTTIDVSFIGFNVSLSEDNTVFVNSSYTGSVESGTRTNPYKSLSSTVLTKISNVKNNLFIANGLYVVSSTLSLSKNMNIIGEDALNTIIKGNGSNRIFSVTGFHLVNIVNVTLMGGNSGSYSYYGGAIFNSNKSTLNLINTVFKNNVAKGYSSSYYSSTSYAGSGGAIYNDGGILRIFNSTFFNNTAIANDEAFGGAIYNYMGDVYIINSTFVNNSANADNTAGGAIFSKYVSNLYVINSSFISNVLVSNYSLGGAIATWKVLNHYIINSTFDSNVICGNYTFASAISNDGVLFEVINSNFTNNLAKGTAPDNTTIYNLNGRYYFINSNMENNTIANTKENMLLVFEDQLCVDLPFDVELLADLPSSYDLRDLGLVTSVKDQSTTGSCWTFAMLAAVESYLLKYEGVEYDFSENNFQNSMGIYGGNGTDIEEGGNFVMGTAYLVRWGGPVNETDDPFSTYYTSPKTNLTLAKHVQDILYVPLRLNYTDNDQIKYALMKYGALYASIYAGDNFKYYSSIFNNVSTLANHAITIVGWDDNYSASNFQTTPPGDGAFIIKNSWGTSYGDEGYWYISYYDKTFLGYGMDEISVLAITNVENITNYKGIYQYDPIGYTYESLGYNCDTAWFANQFTSESNNPLSAFGLYTFGYSDYVVDVYVNGEFKYTQKGNISSAGYHTVKLNEYVELNEGDIFRINVKLTTPSSLFPIAVESKRSVYSSRATASLNQSFISSDGKYWTDTGNYLKLIKFNSNSQDCTLNKTNVCLKAYTAYASDLSLNVTSNVSLFRSGDFIEISLNLTNHGDLAENINVSSYLDGSVEIISYNLTNGSFDKNANLWVIDSLDTNESVILTLVVYMGENKEVVENIFLANTSSYVIHNGVNASLELYFSGFTKFIELGNITTLSKSSDIVNLTLTDALNRGIAGKNISVILYDLDGKLISNTSVVTDDNGIYPFVLNLTEGKYFYNLYFYGDNDFDKSESSFVVDVKRRDVNFSAVNLTEGIYVLSKSGDNITISLVDGNSRPVYNRSFVVCDEDKRIVFNLNNGEYGFDEFILNLTEGNYTFFASFDGDELYTNHTQKFNVYVSKREAPFMLSSDENVIDSSAPFTICLVDGSTSGVNLLENKTIIFSVVDSKGNTVNYTNITNEMGIAKLYLDEGSYLITSIFANDDEYEDVNITANLVVNNNPSDFTIQSYLSLVENYVYTGQNVSVMLSDENNLSLINRILNITVVDTNNQTVINDSLFTNENGIADFNLSEGNYTVNVIFAGDGIYSSSTLNKNISVVKFNPVLNIVEDDIRLGDNLTIQILDFNGNGLTNKTISLYVIDDLDASVSNYTFVSNETGEISLFLDEGTYRIIAKFAGDSNYSSSSISSNIKVTEKEDNFELQEAINNANDGDTVYLRDNYNYKDINHINITKNITIKGGKNTTITSSEDADCIFYIVTQSEISIYNSTEAAYDVNITSINFNLHNNTIAILAKAEDINNLYSNISAINITNNTFNIADNTTSPHSITILEIDSNSKNFNPNNPVSITNNTLIAGMDLFNLWNTNWGNQSGDVYIPQADLISTYLSIEKIDSGNGEIIIFLKDINNLPIENSTIVYSINDTNYSLTTNSFGQITINNLTGTVNIEAFYLGDNTYNSSFVSINFTSKSISKKSTKLLFDNMTTDVVLSGERNGEYFNATLIDSETGKTLSNKTIQIGFNGNIYTKTTNSEGKISLQINIGYQSANTFSITFLGDDEYNGTVGVAMIVVNPLKTKLTSSKTTYKSAAKTKTIKATLKSNNGTLLSNKKITFTVNNKTYISTTNSKGVASIKIPITTKGTYTFTAKFDGDYQYASKSTSSKLIIN